jgi:predicted transcriptional regulator of viral defense system
MVSPSEAAISREIPTLFPEYSLVNVNEVLPGNLRVDFHFRDQTGTDIFIDISNREIGRTSINQIVNLYASISNIEPPLKKFELIVIGPKVVKSVQNQVSSLPIKLLTYDEIGISSSQFDQPRLFEKQRLSPKEAFLVAQWESQHKTTVRASDVQEELGCTQNYAHFLLHRLEDKQWIERITRGLYQFIPLSYGYPERIPSADPFSVASSLVTPYYCSYYTSNSHYGFTTQMPFTLFIATLKKKPGLEWASGSFKFVTLSKQKFFGYTQERVFGTEVLMAEPEKSVVDSFDKPKYAGGIEQLARITWRALASLDKEKLIEYALQMNSHALIQRLGFIIDFLSTESLVKPLPTSLRKTLLQHVGKSPIYLDSRRKKSGQYSKDWLVMNNIPKPQLLCEIEIR